MAKPLAVRWLAHELPELQAGTLVTARLELENAGETPWNGERFTVSYHWLDELGNPIVWDGLRTPVAAAPGQAAQVAMRIRAPIPPGRYRLSIDVVDESRFWFGELGEETLDFAVDVLERDGVARAHLGEAVPAEDWEERVRGAHREGYGIVGGSVVARAGSRELEPYARPGRVPGFAHPLVCPSVLEGVDVEWTQVAGLPAAVGPPGEPALYDGRIRARLPSGRRRG